MMRRAVTTRLFRGGVVLCAAALMTTARGQSPVDALPSDLEGVGVDEKLGERIPGDLVFTDETGAEVRLQDYFDAGKPIILTPVFYNCPQLCTLVLNGMVSGLNETKWSAGEEFEIVTFSFKTGESPELAHIKKKAYLTQYHRESAREGWHFLVGSDESIARLTEAIGFRFQPLDDGNIAHTATILFLTPDGVISRYMNDVMFQPRDLELALVEAGEGTIGSPMDKLVLFMCYQYDPAKGSYVPAAWKIMRAGGLLTLLLIVGGVAVLWKRGSRNAMPQRHTIALSGQHT